MIIALFFFPAFPFSSSKCLSQPFLCNCPPCWCNCHGHDRLLSQHFIEGPSQCYITAIPQSWGANNSDVYLFFRRHNSTHDLQLFFANCILAVCFFCWRPICLAVLQRLCRPWKERRGTRSSSPRSTERCRLLSSRETLWRTPTPTPRCWRTSATLPRPWRTPMQTCKSQAPESDSVPGNHQVSYNVFVARCLLSAFLEKSRIQCYCFFFFKNAALYRLATAFQNQFFDRQRKDRHHIRSDAVQWRRYEKNSLVSSANVSVSGTSTRWTSWCRTSQSSASWPKKSPTPSPNLWDSERSSMTWVTL